MTGLPAKLLGIYCHLPFCITKCPYCDFYSVLHKSQSEEWLTQAIIREIDQVCVKIDFSSASVDTIYFGGGTPSILKAKNLRQILEKIFSAFSVSDRAEITIEANPGSITKEKLQNLRDLGFNRLSVGIQSFFDHHLKRLGRSHTAIQALEAYYWARTVGFDNLSVDLIYGVPEQTLEEWQQTLQKTIELRPEHISAYCLTIEEATPFARWFQKGKLRLPDEESQFHMFTLAHDLLFQTGFEHYELSNWARPGFRSQHNQKYWNGQAYVGFGPAAHSFWNNQRWANLRDLKKYSQLIKKDQLPHEFIENLSQSEQRTEAVFTGLRQAAGIDLANFQKRFGNWLKKEKSAHLQSLLASGYLVLDNGYLRLTREGWFVADSVIATLI